MSDAVFFTFQHRAKAIEIGNEYVRERPVPSGVGTLNQPGELGVAACLANHIVAGVIDEIEDVSVQHRYLD